MLLHVTAILALELGLVPPPQQVVLDSKYLGPVTLDHRGHIDLRISCKVCHGPGVVKKFGGYTAQQAHATCTGCHEAQKRGPTVCRDCHRAPAPGGATALPAPPPPPPPPEPSPAAATGAVAAASPTAATKTESAPDAAPEQAPAAAVTPAAPAATPVAAPIVAPAPPAAAPEAAEASRAGPATPAPATEPWSRASAVTVAPLPAGAETPVSATSAAANPAAPRARKRGGFGAVEVGYLVLGASGGVSSGPSFALSYRDGPLVFTHGLGMGFRSQGWRALGLWGAGVVFPVRERWNVLGSAVAGVDVIDRSTVTLCPALGGRVALEWVGRAEPFVPFTFAVTVASDLLRPRTGPGEENGAVTVSFSFSAGVFAAERRPDLRL